MNWRVDEGRKGRGKIQGRSLDDPPSEPTSAIDVRIGGRGRGRHGPATFRRSFWLNYLLFIKTHNARWQTFRHDEYNPKLPASTDQGYSFETFDCFAEVLH